MDSINKPTPDTWDKVADNYNIEIHEMEYDLAYEFISKLESLGIYKGSTLLEIGSGSGHISCILAQQGYKVTLLDFSDRALEKSKETFSHYGVNGSFIKGDLMDLSHVNEHYDAVWNSGVMEHFGDEELVQAYESINGLSFEHFIFLVPNPKSFPYLLYRYKLASEGKWDVGKEYLREDYDDFLHKSGLNFQSYFYIGAKWTEVMVNIIFEGKKVVPDYNLIEQNGLFPKEDRYLIGYVSSKQQGKKLEKKVENVSEGTTEYRTTIFDLICEINKVRTSLDNEINELKNLVTEKTAELNTKNDDLFALKNLIVEKDKELDNKNIQLKDADKSYSELRYRLESEIQSYQNEIQIYKEEIDNKNKYHEIIAELEYIKNQYLNSNEYYSGLFEQIKYSYNKIDNKLLEINNTKLYRIYHSLRRIKYQFLKGNFEHKKEFLSWVGKKILNRSTSIDNRYNPLFEIKNIQNSIISIIDSEHELSATAIDAEQTNEGEIGFKEYYHSRKSYYKSLIDTPFTENEEQIIEILNSMDFKGIVVYPDAVMWEPVQRPQHILFEMGKKGFLCFFCEPNPHGEQFNITNMGNNVYKVNSDISLLKVLKNKFVIVLCTWLGQIAWIEQLPNKYIWYDILDKLEFLSLYDEDAAKKNQELLKRADFISYTAKKLEKYVSSINNAVYIPNGCNLNDFNNNNVMKPQELEGLKGEKIIGYFGAIEEWFDIKLISKLAKNNLDWDFVLIGKIGSEIVKPNLPNVHFLGAIPYKKLNDYAQFFDVCMIPFKVNDLTNSVSPVKFFEYAALGKPVVTSPIFEMLQYECSWVRVANNVKSFEREISKCLTKEVSLEAKENGKKLAQQNTWASRINVFEDALINSISGWTSFSNINISNTISVMAPTFLHFDGDNFYSGGAERYLIDLQKLSKDLGVDLNIFQYGNYTWFKKYKNVNVISLSNNYFNAKNLSVEIVQRFNQAYYEYVFNTSLLNIYSPFFIAKPYCVSPSIGISHGVAWDNPHCVFNNGEDFWNAQNTIIDSAKSCDTIVSVDTNTANWFQTIDFEVGNQMKVIPNYVDLELFKPKENLDELGDRIQILYPRRLYEARGLYLVLGILDDILENYPQVDFVFVGKGFEEDTRHVVMKQEKWGDRVQWYSLPPDEMYKAYENADIALVPTRYSEGTSLSCLEAMASGNAVISTRIGGLTDLVINNYNGLLIEPNEEALKQAIEMLLNDPAKFIAFKKKAVEVAQAFDKKTWEYKWKQIIKDTIGDVQLNNRETKLAEIYLETYNEEKLNNLSNIVIDLLNNNYLVYIRVRDQFPNNQKSFGRLQWVPWEQEVMSIPDRVYAEENLVESISVKVDYVLDDNLITTKINV